MMMIPQAGESMDARAGLRTLRINHVALCSSVLIYGLLVYLMLTFGVMPEEGFVSDIPNLDLLRILCWFLAVGALVAIWVIKRRFLSPEALRRHDTPMQEYFTWHIRMWALGEAIAIPGLLLFLLAALLEDFLTMAGISLAILYWLRPKKDDYHALVRQALST